MKEILDKLPPKYQKALKQLGKEAAGSLEEIRILEGRQVLFYCGGKEYPSGIVTEQREVEAVLSAILSYSVYSFQKELSRGYMTLPGGHRVGVCGTVVEEETGIKVIKDISSLNIRRCRQVPKAAEKVIGQIMPGGAESVRNSLLISPPGCGKTTLLREIIRSLSEGGCRVSVVDERGELGGAFRGRLQMDLGPRTDVLTGCPKARGMMMMLRTMTPRVLCFDELGGKRDQEALEEVLYAGVKVITTVHGTDYEGLLHTPLERLLRRGIFERFIVLGRQPSVGTVKQIRDEKGRALL